MNDLVTVTDKRTLEIIYKASEYMSMMHPEDAFQTAVDEISFEDLGNYMFCEAELIRTAVIKRIKHGR